MTSAPSELRLRSFGSRPRTLSALSLWLLPPALAAGTVGGLSAANGGYFGGTRAWAALRRRDRRARPRVRRRPRALRRLDRAVDSVDELGHVDGVRRAEDARVRRSGRRRTAGPQAPLGAVGARGDVDRHQRRLRVRARDASLPGAS